MRRRKKRVGEEGRKEWLEKEVSLPILGQGEENGN